MGKPSEAELLPSRRPSPSNSFVGPACLPSGLDQLGPPSRNYPFIEIETLVKRHQIVKINNKETSVKFLEVTREIERGEGERERERADSGSVDRCAAKNVTKCD